METPDIILFEKRIYCRCLAWNVLSDRQNLMNITMGVDNFKCNNYANKPACLIMSKFFG